MFSSSSDDDLKYIACGALLITSGIGLGFGLGFGLSHYYTSRINAKNKIIEDQKNFINAKNKIIKDRNCAFLSNYNIMEIVNELRKNKEELLQHRLKLPKQKTVNKSEQDVWLEQHLDIVDRQNNDIIRFIYAKGSEFIDICAPTSPSLTGAEYLEEKGFGDISE